MKQTILTVKERVKEIIMNKLLSEMGCEIKVITQKAKFYSKDKTKTFNHCKIKITKNLKSFVFKFEDFSSPKNIKPKLIDIVFSLRKNDVGTFEDFCEEYGYTYESLKDSKVYKFAVKLYTDLMKDFLFMNKLFNKKELKTLSDLE